LEAEGAGQVSRIVATGADDRRLGAGLAECSLPTRPRGTRSLLGKTVGLVRCSWRWGETVIKRVWFGAPGVPG